MNKHVFAFIAALAVAGTANASGLPHTFSAGEPAVADDVNENFQYLENKVNEVGAVETLDWSSQVTRTFENFGHPHGDNCQTRERSYQLNGDELVMTETFKDKDLTQSTLNSCRSSERTYKQVDGDWRLMERKFLHNDVTLEFKPDGILVRPEVITPGMSLTSVVEHRVRTLEDPDGYGEGVTIYNVTFRPVSGGLWSDLASGDDDPRLSGCVAQEVRSEAFAETYVNCGEHGTVLIYEERDAGLRRWEAQP